MKPKSAPRRDEDDDAAGDPVEADELLARIGGGLEAQMPLEIGQKLQIQQSGRWWGGQILELRDNGEVKIHYTGWETSWDEWVTRERLRLASPGPREVVVTLEGGSQQRGVLEGQTADFLLLRRDKTQIFVAKKRVLWFETVD